MKKWEYILPNAQDLRKAIDDDNAVGVLFQVIKAYEWAADMFGEEISEAEYVREELELEALDEDSVNMHLDNFWDYCDRNRIWVEL